MRRGRFAGTWWRPGVRWSLGVGLALAGAIVWLSWPGNGAAGNDEGPAAAAPALPSDAVRALPAPTREDAGSTTASAHASGSELIEVCGVGWVEPDASGAWDTSAVSAVPDVAASQRAVLEALRRNDGELGAAMAAALELHGALREGSAGAPSNALHCSGSDCAAGEQDRQLAAGQLEQLAKQATTTLDPRVYALALQECERMSAQGSCALLSLEQWAHLDTGNAVPWLQLLERARRRNDPAQIQEALYRIGTAARFDERLFAVAGRVADNAGASDVDIIAAQLLAVDAFMQASARQLPYNALTAVCTAAAFADANRRQACDGAAMTLVERSDTLMALVIGTAVGRRLGWPDDRIDALRGLEYARAAMARENERGVETPSLADMPSSCGGARRVLALLSRQARGGEVQPVRDWLAANGRSIAPYALQAHEMLRKRDEAEAATVAAAAASSAAPASSAVAMAPAAAIPYSEAPPPAR